jgi:hypothetical protein
VLDYVPLTFLLQVDSPTFNPEIEKFVQCYQCLESSMAGMEKKDEKNIEQVIPLINNKLQYLNLSKDRRAVSHCKAKLVSTHFDGHNLWILKPTGFNRGRGVHVFQTIDELKKLLKDYSEGVTFNINSSCNKGEENKEKEKERESRERECDIKGGENVTQSNSWELAHPPISNIENLPEIIKCKTFVVQKYIEQPLLIRNRKFDIRVWVLVTHEMKVYMFKEGYIRTSSEEYSSDDADINKTFIHLTNNAVQKHSNTYGLFEDANQMSFKQFQVYFY